MSDTANYIALPVWNGTEWVPTYSPSQERMAWPNGFDPAELLPPKYNLGQTVDFNWSNGVRRGVIRRIWRHGGTFDPSRGQTEIEIARERYHRNVSYDIVWNAHGRYVDENQIVG